MKHILILILLAATLPAWAQKVKVEARDGKAVIVRKDTTGTETREVAEWKENPRQILSKELEEVEKYLAWLDGKIDRLQDERKGKRQEQRDLQKAIADLDAGLIRETGIPGEKTAAPAPEQTPPPKKPAQKKKSTRKPKTKKE